MVMEMGVGVVGQEVGRKKGERTIRARGGRVSIELENTWLASVRPIPSAICAVCVE
jgi:hypothetical protein